MADEKRRLIYELLVEAKGLADGTKQAKSQLTDMTRVAGLAKNALGTMFAGISVAAAVRGLVAVNDEITTITAQLKVFSIEGQQASDAIAAMQNTAVATGSSLQSIVNAYKDLSDVAETLGLSQSEVAELVDASTRAMIAQGGSAEQAAQQLSTMAFAIEKGNLTQRELKTLLRDNEVLQRAFESALGLTTKEILEQASAGGLNADQLKRVLDVYKQLGAQQDVPVTLDRVTTSVVEATKAFAASASKASGFSDVLQQIGRTVMPESAEAANDWGATFGKALRLTLPIVVQATLEMNKLAEAQRAQADAARKAHAAAPPAFPGPVPITAGERREQRVPLIETEGFTDADREAITEQQRLDRLVQESRVRNNLLDLALRMTRESEEAAARQEIVTLELDHQKEIRYEIVNLQEIEQEQAANMAETVANMKMPTLPTESILDGLIDAEDAAQVLAHTLTGVFSGAVTNARDFFRTIAQGLAEVIAQKAILQAIGGDDGQGGLLKILGLVGSAAAGGATVGAKGLVMNHGALVPMAYGGIVSSPTMFPMAGGRTGLMGEAGAEAVMPLRRGSDGRLGVAGTMPRVVVNNQTGVAADAQVNANSERLEITLRAATLGANIAVAEVNRSIRNGYGLTANSLSRSYGLRRRV